MVIADEEEEEEYFPSNIALDTSEINNTGIDTPPVSFPGGLTPSMVMSQGHDPDLLVSEINSRLHSDTPPVRLRRTSTRQGDGAFDEPPTFQTGPAADIPSSSTEHAPGSGGGIYKSLFDFGPIEAFAGEERQRLGLVSGQDRMKSLRRRVAARNMETADAPTVPVISENKGEISADAIKINSIDVPDITNRPRGLSGSVPSTRRPGGKLALFESTTAPLPPFDFSPHSPLPLQPPLPLPMPAYSDLPNSPMRLLPPPVDAMENKPYRFSFYSNALKSTIHARSLSELPAEGQSFEELFTGKKTPSSGGNTSPPTATPNVLSRAMTPNNALNSSGAATPQSSNIPMNGLAGKRDLLPSGQTGSRSSEPTAWKNHEDANSWWLDVLSPTGQ
jgi:magnesium transporter